MLALTAYYFTFVGFSVSLDLIKTSNDRVAALTETIGQLTDEFLRLAENMHRIVSLLEDPPVTSGHNEVKIATTALFSEINRLSSTTTLAVKSSTTNESTEV